MSFLYRQAGRVLQGVEDGKASLKTLTLARKSGLGGGKGADQDGSKRKVCVDHLRQRRLERHGPSDIRRPNHHTVGQ